MNQNAFDEGKAAYQRHDWEAAVNSLERVKGEGELCGEADHLLGNAYMQLREYVPASLAYNAALEDEAYGKRGAISCNLGRALIAAGRPQEAVAALLAATQDAAYETPYKAYLALGSAYERLSDIRNAGIAYRNAAIDDSNPNPSGALMSLGSCFMKLSRPVDAVEAYRTALDFSTDQKTTNEVYRDLALAYVAANRMPEAVDAFTHATADGSLALTPEQSTAYDAARRAINVATGRKMSDTDAMLAAVGYGTGSFDPLDPTGASGELMPSPEDTGFFEVNEADLIAQGRKRRKGGGCLKFFITLLVLALLAAGAAYFAYTRGYGWPTQQSVIEGMFRARGENGNIGEYLSKSVNDQLKEQYEDIIPAGATPKISGIDQNATESTALVTATLANGGTQDYTIRLVRDGIGWKVSGVEVLYVSQGLTDPTVSTEGTVDVAADAEAEQAAEGDTSSEDAPPEGEAAPGEGAVDEAPADANAEEGGSEEGEYIDQEYAEYSEEDAADDPQAPQE